MERRTLLLGAATMAALGVAATAASATPRRPASPGRAPAVAARRLDLRHAATGARFAGTYHNGWMPDPVAVAELSLVLADTRTGAVRPFDPRVLDILWEMAQRSRQRGEFVILSGYRTPETNAAVDGAGDSQHLRAAALDVMVPAERLPGFAKMALGLARGGVGVYPQRGFVHLDSGPVRHWGDLPGGTAAPTIRAAPDPLARMAEAWAATRTP